MLAKVSLLTKPRNNIFFDVNMTARTKTSYVFEVGRGQKTCPALTNIVFWAAGTTPNIAQNAFFRFSKHRNIENVILLSATGYRPATGIN